MPSAESTNLRFQNSKKRRKVLMKEDLKEFERYVDTDEYVEQIARERLGLVYKGEVIFEPDDSK